MPFGPGLQPGEPPLLNRPSVTVPGRDLRTRGGPGIGFVRAGADDGTRTRNLRFTKPLLYQLSYIGATGRAIPQMDLTAPGDDRAGRPDGSSVEVASVIGPCVDQYQGRRTGGRRACRGEASWSRPAYGSIRGVRSSIGRTFWPTGRSPCRLPLIDSCAFPCQRAADRSETQRGLPCRPPLRVAQHSGRSPMATSERLEFERPDAWAGMTYG